MDFSVIIPCYNCENSILRTLDSLARQVYQSFEVVIVNDGSTDDTDRIIRDYLLTSKMMIKYFTQTNAGVSRARNKGINECSGRYITFLDADDEYSDNCLLNFINAFNDNIDMVAGRYIFSNEKDHKSCKHNEKRLSRKELFEMYRDHKRNRVNFWCCAYRKSIIEKENIQFDESTCYGEDSEFIFKYIFYCKNGGILLDDIVYKYYINDTSATHSYNYKIVENIHAYKRVAEYWQNEADINKEDLIYLVERAIWSGAKDLSRMDSQSWTRFNKEYRVIDTMRYMARKSKEIDVRVLSLIYLVSSNAFRRVICFLLS